MSIQYTALSRDQKNKQAPPCSFSPSPLFALLSHTQIILPFNLSRNQLSTAQNTGLDLQHMLQASFFLLYNN
jgi:hypothetical protein